MALMVKEYRESLEAAADLEEGTGFEAEWFWKPTWFPIARLVGGGVLVLDLVDPSSPTSPVHAVWWESGPTNSWPSLAAFARFALHGLASGRFIVGPDGVVDGPALDDV